MGEETWTWYTNFLINLKVIIEDSTKYMYGPTKLFFFFLEKKDPFQLRETVQISLEYINNIW